MSDTTPASGAPGDGKGRFLTFWTTLPGILTGIAAVLTAVVGIVGILNSGSGNPAPTSEQTSPPTAASATTSSPGVLAHGRLSLISGDSADLEHGVIDTSANTDITFGPESTPHLFATATAFLAPTESPATKRACTVALTSRHDAFEILPQLATDSICVSTTEGHVAAVKIISSPGVGSAKLTLEYTVWS